MLRITEDPAPRLLYCFETHDDGKTVDTPSLVRRIEAGDLVATELLVGVSDISSPFAKQAREANVEVSGVRTAIERICEQIDEQLKASEVG